MRLFISLLLFWYMDQGKSNCLEISRGLKYNVFVLVCKYKCVKQVKTTMVKLKIKDLFLEEKNGALQINPVGVPITNK